MSTMINEVRRMLDESVSAFHCVKTVEDDLIKAGYLELKENVEFKITQNKYYVKRNNSSIIAFNIGQNLKDYTYNICASHTDFPSFKLKPNTNIFKNGFNMLNTEVYGGPLLSTFFDRPLSLAGRVVINEDGLIKEKLINIDKDLMFIPNLAIHMNREANNGVKLNPQTDMLPILGMDENVKLEDLLKKEVGADVLTFDLNLYTREKSRLLGINDEFLMSSHLDNMLMVFTSLKGFIDQVKEGQINVFVAYDNEEVGSMSKQGAFSTFMNETMKRLAFSLGFSEENHLSAIARSFMISADNAHALSPNYVSKYDETNRVNSGKGLAVKYHSGQSYTTDSISLAIFKEIAKKADKDIQIFANRSDVRGGSTLGSLSQTQVALNTVDIGIGQFAMHSIMETCSVSDITDTIEILRVFYNTKISKDSQGNIIVD